MPMLPRETVCRLLCCRREVTINTWFVVQGSDWFHEYLIQHSRTRLRDKPWRIKRSSNLGLVILSDVWGRLLLDRRDDSSVGSFGSSGLTTCVRLNTCQFSSFYSI